jgi:hypothetical protein
LRNLETGQAVCRVERSDYDFNLSVPLPIEPDRSSVRARRQEVTTVSRKKYGTPRADVEAIQAKSRETPLSAEPLAPAFAEPPNPTIAKAPQEAANVKTGVAQVDTPPPLSEILKAAPAPVAEIKEPPREQGQGRGGPEHQAIQKRIKEEAEKLGFRSTIEKPVLDGQASIDVWLERNGLVIACEVSFTNTEENESGKIIKCLKAGIPKFAMICTDVKKLQKIAKAISGNFEAELAARVEYFQPDPFIEYLRALPVEPPRKPEKIRRGYKVRHSISTDSAEEQKAKEETAIRVIADSMRK